LQNRAAMKACETCGNTYDKAFEVSIGGTTHTFDSFIGHGMEARGQYFCCAYCARQAGVHELHDRADDRGTASP